MGAVKGAVMEVQDAVASCVETGLSLEDTVNYCNDLYNETKDNSYLTDEHLIKQIYNDWRGGEM